MAAGAGESDSPGSNRAVMVTSVAMMNCCATMAYSITTLLPRCKLSIGLSLPVDKLT